jgi:methyl-accepting chemotaxis protein WspA
VTLLRFRQQADAFNGQLEQLLDLYGKDREAARRVLLEELIPAWDKGRQTLGEMITLNKRSPTRRPRPSSARSRSPRSP